MELTIFPLNRGEIPQFVRIELEAFRTHPRIQMLWPRGYTTDLFSFYESEKEESFVNPDCHLMKAVDKHTGVIVGVSEWSFALNPKNEREKGSVDPDGGPPPDWPLDGNWELRRFFTLNLEKWKKEHLKDKPYSTLR